MNRAFIQGHSRSFLLVPVMCDRIVPHRKVSGRRHFRPTPRKYLRPETFITINPPPRRIFIQYKSSHRRNNNSPPCKIIANPVIKSPTPRRCLPPSDLQYVFRGECLCENYQTVSAFRLLCTVSHICQVSPKTWQRILPTESRLPSPDGRTHTINASIRDSTSSLGNLFKLVAIQGVNSVHTADAETVGGVNWALR